MRHNSVLDLLLNPFVVYQKVCPPPVFALLLELSTLTGNAPPGASAFASAATGGSLRDIDDGLDGSPENTNSQGSWEAVNE